MTSCVDRLAPPDRVLCNADHCDQFQQTSDFHAICNCLDWQGQPIPNCSAKDALYPVHSGQCIGPSGYVPLNDDDCFAKGYRWKVCYCCCSCFAATTPVAVPGGMRKIGDIAIGDQVLAAAQKDGTWSWTPQSVQFSSGSPDNPTGTGNVMFYIEYGDSKSLVATPNQLFLVMPGGKLKRADQLVPGVDQLVSDSGAAVPIARLHSGLFRGGVHHIATAVVSYDDFTGSIDNHLINANGIVSGDYLLQLFQDSEKMKPNMADPAHAPVGTHTYKKLYASAHVQPHVAAVSSDVAAKPILFQHFVPHGESRATVPDNAARLFSQRQEDRLLDTDVPRRAFSDATNKDKVHYYAELYRTFYPEIRFYLDWESRRPNVFAFNEYGQKTVLIGGELLRLDSLYEDAMAIALAFGVGSLLGGSPTDSETGYTAAGQALYFGMGVVMRNAMQTGTVWNDTTTEGKQELLAVINALIAKAKDDEELDLPSLRCLLDVMSAVISGTELPECAGGPVKNRLKVASAIYSSPQITMTYNEAVSPYTATNSKNYMVTPGPVDITGVAVNPTDSASVVLLAELAPGDYTIAARNVRASDGSTLDSQANTAKFTVDKPSVIAGGGVATASPPPRP